jgi:hypothetical protein
LSKYQFHRSAGKFAIPEANSSFRGRWTDNLCHFPLCSGQNVAATVDAISSANDALTTFVISLRAADEMSLQTSMRSVPCTFPSENGPIGLFSDRSVRFFVDGPRSTFATY